jgi:hypothetical protein
MSSLKLYPERAAVEFECICGNLMRTARSQAAISQQEAGNWIGETGASIDLKERAAGYTRVSFTVGEAIELCSLYGIKLSDLLRSGGL